MDMGVLGSLVLENNGNSAVPSAPKPRQLLAFLMLHLNEVVRGSQCITELWADRPPKSAVSTLQTYVLHIRQVIRGALGPEHDGMLATRSQGYQLTADPAALDRTRFTALARLGRAAAAAGDDARSADLFAQALGLWRGPALADVQVGQLSAAHVVDLEETRRGVLERRIEADLTLGRHQRLLDELSALTTLHPRHENLHAQYMLALYRCGHRAAALAVFGQLRDVLGESLGIEPSPRMQRLNSAVLASDPILDAPAGSGSLTRT
ncbi:AfsR/SARP family transcriptional regulator [Streptomyces niger]|uniref:AfsR/SARP family transcriptional regulator n=1 Tax=Streptomyces niger TaxID=66373 RepID=UPI00069C804F|nr:BTAD domain-containing putative transcriptional regulator [Streptomyces niger]